MRLLLCWCVACAVYFKTRNIKTRTTCFPLTWHGSSGHWHSCRGQSFSDTTGEGLPWQMFLRRNPIHLSQVLTQTQSVACFCVFLPSPSTEMSWMANRRMIVQIIPRVIFTFPSTISENQTTCSISLHQSTSHSPQTAHGGRVPSAPMETSFTPLLVMKSRALLTLAILWKRIFPLSGLGNRSPGRVSMWVHDIMSQHYITNVEHERNLNQMSAGTTAAFSNSIKKNTGLLMKYKQNGSFLIMTIVLNLDQWVRVQHCLDHTWKHK